MTRRGLIAGVFLTVIAVAGCRRGQRNEDFIPAEVTAQKALESYLSAWQRGEVVQPVANTSPAVMGADMMQTGGRKLEKFTILGPIAADAPRCFAVRLTLAGPTEERRDRYVVIGLDPLWVLRYEDYEMLLHWDHPMPPKTAAEKK